MSALTDAQLALLQQGITTSVAGNVLTVTNATLDAVQLQTIMLVSQSVRGCTPLVNPGSSLVITFGPGQELL